MKKAMAIGMGILAIGFIATNACAGAVSAIVKTLAVQRAGAVMDRTGQLLDQVVTAGADKAQEAITGYNTNFGGDLEMESEAKVDSIEARRGASVRIGSADFEHSRLVGDVTMRMRSDVGRVFADEGAYVGASSVYMSNTRVAGKTDIDLSSRVGGITAGPNASVRVAEFTSR